MEDDGWITLHNLKILQRKSQIILKDKDEIVPEQEDSNINHTCDFCEKSFINKIFVDFVTNHLVTIGYLIISK